MSRFITTLGALGLSLAATTAFAHGGSQGSMGGFQHSAGLPTMQSDSMGKAQSLTDHDSDRDRHERRELAEKQRIQTEIVRLTENTKRLKAELAVVTKLGNREDASRLTREITETENKIGKLQHEENGPT